MKKIYLILFVFSFAFTNLSSQAPSHKTWDELLNEHVSSKGLVDYAGIKEDKAKFYSYLKTLTKNHPEDSWGKQEIKAYWINAYNAFTVQLIVKHYPVKSIRAIGGAFEKPWDVKFIKIEDKKYSLNDIEHNILRKDFNDPRIHFAVNCAAYSCPKLRNEAYTAAKLDQQLNDQAKDFINKEKYNKISKDKVQISKLFEWYKEDFTQKGSVIDYLNKYSQTTINSNAKINYLDYSWKLNDQ